MLRMIRRLILRIKNWYERRRYSYRNTAEYFRVVDTIERIIDSIDGANNSKLRHSMGVTDIRIKDTGYSLDITFHTLRPGILIGRMGSTIGAIERGLIEAVEGKKSVKIHIVEVRYPVWVEAEAYATLDDL